MKESTALALIRSKMAELEIGDNYILRYRHFILRSGKQLEINAINEYYYLLDPSIDLAVYSQSGFYSVQDDSLDEIQYIHTGKITLYNTLKGNTTHVKFIQVIPCI